MQEAYLQLHKIGFATSIEVWLEDKLVGGLYGIDLKDKKDNSQPTKIKTSGSTFKNPINQSDKKVWQLIKESVPQDLNFGDASISKKHFNFFVNKGNASFNDMIKLINFVQEQVKKNIFQFEYLVF